MSHSASTTRSLRRSNRLRRSSSSSQKFPLPEETFAFVRPSPVQLFVHKQQIDQLIARALDECDRSEVLGCRAYSDSWETVSAQDNVTAFWRQEQPTTTPTAPTNTPTSKSQYRLTGDVSGNYRDLMALHYAETSNDLYEWLQFVNQSVLDAHIIQTVESATAEKPHQYFGVKWAAFQMSKLATKVDQCFVEYMTYCTDRRGREVGVRVTLPIRIPEIDLMMDTYKVRRMETQMVQILRPLDEKTTHTFVMVENDFMPFAPAAFMKMLFRQNRNMAKGMDARRIRHQGLVAEHYWVPNGSRRNCVVCTRAFGATRGRHHCRLCGDVTCRKCAVVRYTVDPLTDKTFKVAKTKFCVLCIVNLRGREYANTSDAAGAPAAPRPITAVDLTASTVAAVKSTTPSQAYEMETLDEDCLSAVWSDTESEGWDYDSVRSSGSSSFSDSEPLDASGEKHLFGKRLQEIAERVEEMGVDDESSTSTGANASRRPNLVLFSPEDVIDPVDFIEIIDTKDMIRGHHVDMGNDLESPLMNSGIFVTDFSRSRSRTDSAHLMGSMSASTRSLDQNLAEQEALLRQMAMATRHIPRRTRRDRSNKYDA